jgi:hypothetical protein
MAMNWIFPFGEPVKDVVQKVRTPKKVFVLGVYASAVHARWISPEGKTLVNALAVASEPYIFWRGDKAEEIISRINKRLPEGAGQLVPPNSKLNGPSGNVLDDKILAPLGLNREDAWLCDLVPHSCMNPSQEKAIARSYLPLSKKFGLPTPTVPTVPRELADDARRSEILKELKKSQATKLILLGDQPIRWFLRDFPPNFKRLSDFIKLGDDHYGEYVPVDIAGKTYDVLALAHPRQIGGLGLSSPDWQKRHEVWIKKQGA